jgi:hypothetical protein
VWLDDGEAADVVKGNEGDLLGDADAVCLVEEFEAGSAVALLSGSFDEVVERGVVVGAGVGARFRVE